MENVLIIGKFVVFLSFLHIFALKLEMNIWNAFFHRIMRPIEGHIVFVIIDFAANAFLHECLPIAQHFRCQFEIETSPPIYGQIE